MHRTLEGAEMNPRYAALTAAAILVFSAATAFAQGDMETPGITTGVAGIAKSQVTITAGATGAPAGFTIWWMKQSDYVANGNEWFLYGDTREGEAYFWGTPTLNTNGSQYTTFKLAPNASIELEIGNLWDESGVTVDNPSWATSTMGELDPGTAYVFCAFANGTPQTYQSGLSVTVQEATNNEVCTRTPGYWKNHEET